MFFDPVKAFFQNLYTKVEPKLPDIMMAVGTAGVIGGTAMACHATTKLPAIMDTYRSEKAAVEKEAADDNECKKKVRSLKWKTAGKVALNYAPAAAVEGLSLTSMWGGYGKMKGRYLGASAAVVTLSQALDKVRENVRNEYGEEAEERVMHGCEEREITRTDENGNEVTEKVKVYPNDRNGLPSPYARYFCYGESTAAERSYDYNLTFLQTMERTFNNAFPSRKKILYNEILHELGYKMSVTGERTGYLYDPKGSVGDNYIDFRIQTVYREVYDEPGLPPRIERVLMIDPNVQGLIDQEAVKRGLMDP